MLNWKIKLYKLLRWSERYTKTDMVYLAKGEFWLLLTQIIATAGSFVVTLVLTNILPKEVFGQYRFIISITTLFAIFTLAGINSSYTRAVAQDESIDLSKIATTRIKWGLLGSLVSIILALYYFTKDNSTLSLVFAVSSIFIPFYETLLVYSYYFKGKGNFKTPAIYESVSRLIQVAILIITALTTQSVLALIIAFFGGQIITRWFFYVKTKNKIKHTETDLEASNETIKYGKKLTALSVFTRIANELDKLLAWHFAGAAQLAIYTIALVFPVTLYNIGGSAAELALVKFSTLNKNNNKHFLSAYKLFLVSIPLFIISLLYILIAPVMMPLFFPEYSMSIILTQVAGPLIVLVPLDSILQQKMVAQENTKIMAFTAILNILLLTILFVLFYSWFGMLGAIYALLIKSFVMLIVKFILANR